ncbi:MAG: ribonuclease E/G [Clostridium sp.]|jgi:ribonuclease G|nr:ribonuclease E/G [Clostridium sp.]
MSRNVNHSIPPDARIHVDSASAAENPGAYSCREHPFQKYSDGKLLFTRYQGKLLSLLLHNQRLIAASAFETSAPSGRIGSVYIGKVKKVVKNISSCFVEIAGEELGFLSLDGFAHTHRTPPFLLNRSYDGRILEGDELIVQIAGEAVKTKQASLTTEISLSGRLVVLAAGKTKANISSKIPRHRKKQLRQMLLEAGITDQAGNVRQDWLFPDSQTEPPEQSFPARTSQGRPEMEMPSFGLIVRTQAGDQVPEGNGEFLAEYRELRRTLRRLYQTAQYRPCFTCLWEAPKPYQAVLNQTDEAEYSEIVTDLPELYQELSVFFQNSPFLSDKNKRIRLYQDPDYSLGKLYSVETKLKEALTPRVWLKSGGYLVIESTEALTVIDVNTGKYTGGAKKGAGEIFLRMNLEAAQEVALQLRLRNLSGIILIDFINMQTKEQEETLLQRLKLLVQKDHTKTVVVDMTPLGLVELTRKRISRSLKEQLGQVPSMPGMDT